MNYRYSFLFAVHSVVAPLAHAALIMKQFETFLHQNSQLILSKSHVMCKLIKSVVHGEKVKLV